MPMAFINQRFTTCSGSMGARHEITGIKPQAHSAALLFYFLLFGKKVNYGIGGIFIEFPRVRFIGLKYLARTLYDHNVHAQAKTQIRHTVLASIFGCKYLSLN